MFPLVFLTFYEFTFAVAVMASTEAKYLVDECQAAQDVCRRIAYTDAESKPTRTTP